MTTRYNPGRGGLLAIAALAITAFAVPQYAVAQVTGQQATVIPTPTVPAGAPKHKPRSYAEDIMYFGSPYTIGGDYNDTTDPYALWAQAKGHLLRLRDVTRPLEDRIKWATDQWTVEQRDEFARHLAEALKDVDVPISYLWNLGVAGTKPIADIKNGVDGVGGTANLETRVTALEADLETANTRIGGMTYDKYGAQGLKFTVKIDVQNRTVGFVDKDGTELKLRGWYDLHGSFFSKAHFASRLLVMVTERDRHLAIWMMDIGAIAPRECGQNVMCIDVDTNVPTRSFLDQKQAAVFLASATKMTNEQIVGLLQGADLPAKGN